MTELLQPTVEFTIDTSHIITEDDEPVDNVFSAKQQRLLVEPLYSNSSWRTDVSFLADANVGLFAIPSEPPVVPDMFLSLNVQVQPDWFADKHRTYFFWEYGKPPELVVEIVSNRKGGELNNKRRRYARMGITYYLVLDPFHELGDELLTIYVLSRGSYTVVTDRLLPAVGLGATLWTGSYEDVNYTWLRWTDLAGNLLLTGNERAEHERGRADNERERADNERERANTAENKAAALAARLRELGIDPDSLT